MTFGKKAVRHNNQIEIEKCLKHFSSCVMSEHR